MLRIVILMIINSESLYLLILYITFRIKTFEFNYKMRYDDFLIKKRRFICCVFECLIMRINQFSRTYNYYIKTYIEINVLSASFLILFLIL